MRSTVATELCVRGEAAGRISARTLAAIAEGLGRSLPIEPLAFITEDSRRFARLIHTDAYEVWLIAWSSAADLELHDHGGSRGAFHVVSGSLVEAYTGLDAPAPLETLVLKPGQTRHVTRTRVHRVSNPGPEEAISVHVYAPPLASMTFYDERPESYLAPLRTEVPGAPEGIMP